MMPLEIKKNVLYALLFFFLEVAHSGNCRLHPRLLVDFHFWLVTLIVDILGVYRQNVDGRTWFSLSVSNSICRLGILFRFRPPEGTQVGAGSVRDKPI